MSFDVREKIYTTVGPGSVGSPSTSHISTCVTPNTNLVNGSVYEELWESFHAETSIAGGVENRFAVGYRIYSRFDAYTKSQGNQVPMVLDLNISASCGFRFDNSVAGSGSSPFGIGVWLHTGEVDGDAITGGRAFMLANESSSSVTSFPEASITRTRVSTSINFNRSVVIYPSFMAFSPLPLAIAVVALFPKQRALDIDGFCGDVSGRLYRSEQEVFNPRAQ